MLRAASHRRLAAACRILRRNRRHFSENYVLGRLLEEYLKAWRGKPAAAHGPRRYNLIGQTYIRRGFYVKLRLYRAAWMLGSHSGESISRMVDFSVRHILPRLLANLLVVPPKSESETRNSEYWRRRWYCRKGPRRMIFLNYVEVGSNTGERGFTWSQTMTVKLSQVKEIAPWDMNSCFAYLYHGENAIYAPP